MTQNEEMGDMDAWKEKVQQDINNLQQGQSQLKSDVTKLQINDQSQDLKITNLQETLSEIKGDTQWIRRKITSAFITALITALVAGMVGIAVTKIWGG